MNDEGSGHRRLWIHSVITSYSIHYTKLYDLGEVYDKGFLKYGQAKGIPRFREALAKHVSKNFKVNVNQENIMVTPGARFGIFTAINTLLNPGDELIVIEPAWPAYKDCALNS